MLAKNPGEWARLGTAGKDTGCRAWRQHDLVVHNYSHPFQSPAHDWGEPAPRGCPLPFSLVLWQSPHTHRIITCKKAEVTHSSSGCSIIKRKWTVMDGIDRPAYMCVVQSQMPEHQP